MSELHGVALNLPTGVFAPQPRRASRLRMALAQGRVEASLMLRHPEQLLLSLIIPIAALIAVAKVPALSADHTLDTAFPMVLSIAAASSGLTGQAISVAFDRRYGALKRAGASGVSASTIIAGKIFAVLVMALVQVVVLSACAFLLGWRTTLLGVALATLVLLAGIAACTALGLLIGGSLSSEIVLGLANLVWLVLSGALGYVFLTGGLASPGWSILIPTVALGAGLHDAFQHTIPWQSLLVLAGWCALGGIAATRLFRFES
ncbi:ABC transporter permease [Corynebacterium tapiri]|uniref:Multidrug ABC transporter permease n=1 Tax=Corynebacterium tapiri TaxID=1448266 RepID=A0A5C4U393_9CORY|nr:ABC transporter permease [Corynebacterium tapiri]TNL97574.1 multidrug ABC transporter permease [Corynebacterium tapiri]